MRSIANYIKKYFLILLVLISACTLLKKSNKETALSSGKQEVVIKKDSAITKIVHLKKDSFVTVTITAVGDLMCHSPQYNNAKTADGGYDFNPSFAEVKKYLSAADLTIGNFETTCAGQEKGYNGFPNFNCPDDYVEAIHNAGFDFLGTANNHSMDTEEPGLLRTIQVIDRNRIHHTGTFSSQHDRDSVRILNLKGIKTGFLNYAYGTNKLLPSAEHKFMLNIIDTVQIKSDIALARKGGAEIVIVFFHYGQEYISEPVESQRFIVQKTIEYGADIILGSHPHVLGAVEFYKTKGAKLDSGLVAWSLGNFISNQNKRYTDAGVMLNISLTKNFLNDSVSVSSVSFIPTWVYRGTNDKKKMHIVFPAEYCLKDSLPEYIEDSLKKKMREAFEDTKEIMTKKSPKVKAQHIQ